MPDPAAEYLVEILDRYVAVRRDGVDGPFGRGHPLWRAFDGFAESVRGLGPVRGRTKLNVKWSAGQGNWARVPWTALMYPEETESTQRGVYAVFLFREDMSGVYVTWNQGVTDLQKQHGTKEARKVLRDRANRLSAFLPDDRRGFRTGDGIDLRTEGSLAVTYEHSTIAFKVYERDVLPSDEELDADLEVVLQAYDRYMESELRGRLPGAAPASPPPLETGPPETAPPASSAFDRAQATEELIRYIEQRGYVYEPWQVAQYVTAVRTKPFVILAGITGTGKSKLPRLVSDGTGGATDLVPVRPDWTDSSEVLGYADLEGVFRPGAVLEIANTATAEDDVHHTVIVDEMNLARVEHYFAEVLSRIEDRRAMENGGFQSSPLVRTDLRAEDAEWGQVRLPPNLALVGTVNMDESAHGFSRKVLDRAFTIELSDVDLRAGIEASPSSSSNSPSVWPVKSWFPRATRLAELAARSAEDRGRIEAAVGALQEINAILTPAQLQTAYRTRDEVALFVVHAGEIEGAFRSRDGERINPLDLALQMKILPRIAGGSGAVRRVLLGLLGWASAGQPFKDETDASELMDQWDDDGRPARLAGARHPGLASRTALMFDRFRVEGFTSYWL